MNNQTLNIRLRVFLITLAIPVFFGVAMLVAFVTKHHFFNLFFALALITSTLIRIFSSKRKYITSFMIDQNKLSVHYITPFLKPKAEEFEISQLQDIELTGSNWLLQYPAAVNIKCNQTWTTFHINSRQLFKDIKGRIASANIAFIK